MMNYLRLACVLLVVAAATASAQTLVNPGFEDDVAGTQPPTGWTEGLIDDFSDRHPGSGVKSIFWRVNDTAWGPSSAQAGANWAGLSGISSGSGSGMGLAMYQAVTVDPGATYELSAFAYLGGWTGDWCRADLGYVDSGTYSSAATVIVDSTEITLPANGGTGWLPLSGEFSPTSSTILVVVFGKFQNPAWNAAAVHVDEVGIVQTAPAPQEPSAGVGRLWELYR